MGGPPVRCWLCATPLIPSAQAPLEAQHESHFADEETGHLMTITNTIIIFIECLLRTAMMLMIL